MSRKRKAYKRAMMSTPTAPAMPGMPQLKPKVDLDKRCGNCACFKAGEGWCMLHRHSTREINYGCRTWLTQEQLDKKVAEKTAYLESEKGIRVNYMLTLMFAMVSASYQIMIRGESMLGELIGGKEWRFERKKALKDMMKDISHIQTLYGTYFENDYKQMMSDYGRKDFDIYRYDGFQMFSSDLLVLGLTMFEHCYNSNAVFNEIIEDIRKRPVDLGLFPPEFVEEFRVK